jgi:hypothetical protein
MILHNVNKNNLLGKPKTPPRVRSEFQIFTTIFEMKPAYRVKAVVMVR